LAILFDLSVAQRFIAGLATSEDARVHCAVLKVRASVQPYCP